VSSGLINGANIRNARRGFFLLLFIVALPALMSCGESPSSTGTPKPTTASDQATQADRATQALSSQPKVLTMATDYAYIQLRPDGNRYLEGQGNMPGTQPLDIKLSGVPQWLVAAPNGAGSLWVAVLEDGTTQAFQIEGGQAVETAFSLRSLPAGAPPLLAVVGDQIDLLASRSDMEARFSHPVPLGAPGRMAFIEVGGDLVVLQDGFEAGRLSVDALPDARLLVDEQERVLLLTKPSTRYPHGIAGDELEATEITLLETLPSLRVVRTITIPGRRVVEGISPIWADLNGDGQREIIVTLSDSDQGAQLVVYDGSGRQVAAGPAVGRGNRWRHQIAVAPFGINGEMELAEVLTPHIGGIAGFYRLEGDSLDLIVQTDGVTSHLLFSRNLDMGLAADLDGDGQPELVVFDQPFMEIKALRRTGDGVVLAWQTPVGGKAVTNLAAVNTGGGIALGVGREDGVLRIWPSP